LLCEDSTFDGCRSVFCSCGEAGAERPGLSQIYESMAKLLPIQRKENVDQGLRDALLFRLRNQQATKAGRWAREEIY
jgi:hypothetical protein